jgi:hypothetical protein
VVAIVAALGDRDQVSDIHRKQANANSYVRDFAEKLQSYVAGGGYVPCATTAQYESPYTVPNPTLYQRSIVGNVEFLTSAGVWQATSAGCADAGLQRVQLKVRSLDDKASETLTVLLRKPCKVGEALCTA